MIAIKFDGGEQLARTLATLPEAVSRKVQTDRSYAGGRDDPQTGGRARAARHEARPDLDHTFCMRP